MTNPRWSLKERRRTAAVARLSQAIAEHRALIRGYVAEGRSLAAEEEALLLERLAANADRLGERALALLAPEHAPWTSAAWASWSPDSSVALPELRVGIVTDAATGQSLELPVVLPISGEYGPIVLVSRTLEESERAAGLLSSLVLRAALNFPRQSRFALLDPERAGASFPFSRHLDRVLIGFPNPQLVLDELLLDLLRIETTVLDRRTPRLDLLSPGAMLGESRQFLAVPAFPAAYEKPAIESIAELAARGGRAGIYTLIHLDLHAAPDAESFLRVPGISTDRVLEMGGATFDVPRARGVVDVDRAPAGGLQEELLRRVNSCGRRDRRIDWTAYNPDATELGWSEGADSFVLTPIGLAGDEVREIWFGDHPTLGRSCGHGVLIGASSEGRGVLIDSMLAGAAVRHSPTRLKFQLFESGGDHSFDVWRRAPQMEVVALRSTPKQAADALAALRSEVERRSLGAGAAAPRLIVVFDGIESLFADGSDNVRADLAHVLQAGPAARIHLLLGASTSAAIVGLVGAQDCDRLDLRVVLQPAPGDVLRPELLGPAARHLIARVCDRPFRAVVNSAGGHDDANLPTQLFTLDQPRLAEVVSRLAAFSASSGRALPPPLVFNGPDLPDLGDNPMLTRLVESGWRDSALVDEIARATSGPHTSPAAHGEERPRVGFLGRPDSLLGHAHLALRRQPTENVAIIMQNPELRAGALAGLLVGILASDHPTTLEVWAVDRGALDTPASDALSTSMRRFERLGVPCRYTRSSDEAAEFVADLSTEVQRRRTLSEPEIVELPTLLLVLCEPERVGALQRVPTVSGVADSELGLELRYVLVQGPAVGVHVVVTSPSLTAIRAVLSDGVIHQDIRHRAVTRVSEEDSFALVRSARAAMLGDRAGTAMAALFDSHTHQVETFTPYSATAETAVRGNGLPSGLDTLLDLLEEQLS